MDKYDTIAFKRSNRNKHSRTNTPLHAEAETLGLAGEVALASALGLDGYEPDASKPTPGYQFSVPLDGGGFLRVKVSTSRSPGNLLVKYGKVVADVYVLAGVLDRDPADAQHVVFLGWATAQDVRAAEVRTLNTSSSYTQPAHAIPADRLRPMAEFFAGLGKDAPPPLPRQGSLF